MIVLQQDILLDRKGVRCVGYLLCGMDSGVPVAAVGLRQTPRTQKIEKG